jgi:hypothetical protein
MAFTFSDNDFVFESVAPPEKKSKVRLRETDVPDLRPKKVAKTSATLGEKEDTSDRVVHVRCRTVRLVENLLCDSYQGLKNVMLRPRLNFGFGAFISNRNRDNAVKVGEIQVIGVPVICSKEVSDKKLKRPKKPTDEPLLKENAFIATSGSKILLALLRKHLSPKVERVLDYVPYAARVLFATAEAAQAAIDAEPVVVHGVEIDALRLSTRGDWRLARRKTVEIAQERWQERRENYFQEKQKAAKQKANRRGQWKEYNEVVDS